MDINNKYLGWLILYIQLIIGLFFSYGYLTRHLIVNNVAVFAILTIILSNLIFLILKGNNFYSIKAFFSILISGFIIAIPMMKYNKPEASFEPIHYGLVLGYLIIILKLYITTPVAIAIELFLKWKKKKTLN